jgi:hypothetical protein
MAFPSGAE